MLRTWALQACISAAVLFISASWVAAQPQQDVAFVSMDEGNLEIYRMRGTGEERTNLTRNASEDTSPCWSPDGSHTAFVTDRDGDFEIYTMRADGSELTRQTHCPDADKGPAWSPDGRKLLFLRRIGGRNRLFTLNVDHGHDTFLTEGDFEDMQPEWSPDGDSILLVRIDRQDIPQIWKIPTGGTEPAVQLTRDENGASYGQWSPDGKWVVYASMRTGDVEIWKMRADGTGQTQLTHAAGPDLKPRWSPDGASIAFVSSRDGNEEIYRMDPDGEGQLNLTRSPGADRNPSWSDDSAHILFDSSRESRGIFAMTADGTGVWALATGNGSSLGSFGPRSATALEVASTPAPQPAGPEFIAFTRNPPGRPEELSGEIWVMDPDGRNQRVVPGTELTRDPAISYDRNWIAYINFNLLAPEQIGLWICRPDGSDRRAVTPADSTLRF